MAKYILDTHVFYWFLTNDDRLPKDIKEDIYYMQNEYCVSSLTLLEIDNLQKLKKIKIQYSFAELIERLKNSNIGIVFDLNSQDLDVLYKLEMKTIHNKTHSDYIDRMLIAVSISRKYTCISADTKFPHYKKDKLQLINIEP
jgi:PIN domain nuclease of toxin-antitoxin system